MEKRNVLKGTRRIVVGCPPGKLNAEKIKALVGGDRLPIRNPKKIQAK